MTEEEIRAFCVDTLVTDGCYAIRRRNDADIAEIEIGGVNVLMIFSTKTDAEIGLERFSQLVASKLEIVAVEIEMPCIGKTAE